jgi:hypothetical protein
MRTLRASEHASLFPAPAKNLYDRAVAKYFAAANRLLGSSSQSLWRLSKISK